MIPSTLGSEQALPYLANSTIEIAKELDTFIVENIRSARRFLRKVGFDKDFDQVQFFELNRHTQDIEIPAMLEPMKKGIDVGLISEAGVPVCSDAAEWSRESHRSTLHPGWRATGNPTAFRSPKRRSKS